MFLYNETTSFISSINEHNIPCYLIDDLEKIYPDEYINPLIFNKVIYKVAYNLINLKNNLIGYFQAGYNIDNLITYDQLIYDDFFQNLRLNDDLNFFIHNNEATSVIINRVLEQIWNIQNLIIERMKTKYVASPNLMNFGFRII